MGSMETKGKMAAGKSDGFTCRLDPNRVRTDAEVATFAEVFQIPVDEARRILTATGRKCRGAAESSFSGRSGDAELKSISEKRSFLFLGSSDLSGFRSCGEESGGRKERGEAVAALVAGEKAACGSGLQSPRKKDMSSALHE